MRKAILGLLAVIVLLIAGFCIVVATRPPDFKVTRSSTFSAGPDAIFGEINDFHHREAWSPWAKVDPQMKVSYSGPAAGKGASYAWAGNTDVGSGQMTIIDSKPNELININLEFIEPFAARSLTQFELKPNGDKTTVTWTMNGHNNFVAKAMCMFMDMDKMVGGDFEKGLAQLKPIVEAGSMSGMQQ